MTHPCLPYPLFSRPCPQSSRWSSLIRPRWMWSWITPSLYPAGPLARPDLPSLGRRRASIFPPQVNKACLCVYRQYVTKHTQSVITSLTFVSYQEEFSQCCLMEVCRSPRPLCRTLERTYVWLKTRRAQRWARPNSEYKVERTLKSW